MSLQGALLATNVLFVALAALTVAVGMTSLMLGRAVDRAKDREIATLRLQAAEATAGAAHQMAQVEAQLLGFLGGAAGARVIAPPHAEPVAGALPPPAAPRGSGATSGAKAVPSAAGAPSIHSLGTPALASVPHRPNRLTPLQRQRMGAILTLAPSMIMITTDGRPDSEAFADDLQALFAQAGWQVDRAVYASLNKPLTPLSANLKSTPVDVAVRGAFAAAGIALPPRDPNAASADREIFVGSNGGRA